MKHPAQCLSNEFVDQMALSERGRVEVKTRFGEEMVESIYFICVAGRGKTLPDLFSRECSISSELGCPNHRRGSCART